MLGSATVLCTDKTGTLTENRMTVAELRPVGGQGNSVRLVEAALLASAREAHEPMERAIAGRATLAPGGIGAIYAGLGPVRQYGLRPDLLAMTNVWRRDGNRQALAFAKGAPETIGALCKLDAARQAWLTATVNEMAGQGERVLGVARAVVIAEALPETQQGFALSSLA